MYPKVLGSGSYIGKFYGRINVTSTYGAAPIDHNIYDEERSGMVPVPTITFFRGCNFS